MFTVLRKITSTRLFRDISFLTLSSWIAQGLLLYRSYLIPRVLGPQGFGEWRILTLVLFYSTFTHFGTIEAYQREAPVLRGKGNLDALAKVTQTTFAFWNLMSLVSIALFVGWVIFHRAAYGAELTMALCLVSPLLLLQSVQYFLNAKLCAEINFRPASYAMLIQGVVNVVGILILMPHFGLNGAIISMILAYLLTIFYLALHARPRLSQAIDFPSLRHLVKVGLPITVMLVIYNTLTTVDQILIGRMWDTKSMGLYGLSFSIIVILARIPTTVSAAIEPRFLEHCGRNGLTRKSYLYISEQIVVLSLLVPFFAGLAAICAPPAMRLLLPKFTGAIPVIHITLIGFSALAYTYPLKSLIIFRRLQWPCVAILGSGLVFCAGIDFAMIKFIGKQSTIGPFAVSGLAAVACGSTLSYLLVSIVETQYVLKDGLVDHKGGAAAFHLQVFGLLALASAFVWALMQWVRLPNADTSRTADIASGALQAIVFSLTFGLLVAIRGGAIYRRIGKMIIDGHKIEPDEAHVTEV